MGVLLRRSAYLFSFACAGADAADEWAWEAGWNEPNDVEWTGAGSRQLNSDEDYDAYASWLMGLAHEIHLRNPDPNYLTLLCPAPENIMDLLRRSLTIYSMYIYNVRIQCARPTLICIF